jgi:hypothetical protein
VFDREQFDLLAANVNKLEPADNAGTESRDHDVAGGKHHTGLTVTRAPTKSDATRTRRSRTTVMLSSAMTPCLTSKSASALIPLSKVPPALIRRP